MRRLMMIITLLSFNAAFASETPAPAKTPEPLPSTKLDEAATIANVKTLRQEEKLDDAEKLALEYLKQYPNNADMQLLLASVYYQKKDYANAKTVLNDAIKNYPNYTDLKTLLARVEAAENPPKKLEEMDTLSKVKELRKEGKLGEAEVLAKQYLAQYPKDADMQLLLASIYYQQKRYEESKGLLHEGLKNYPQYTDLSDLLKNVENAQRTLTMAPSGSMSAQLGQGVNPNNQSDKKNHIIFYQNSIYATSPYGYWDFTSLYYVRDTEFGNVLGAANYASRYGQATAQGQLGTAVKLSKDVYVELNTTYADNLYLFPKYTIQGEIYFNVYNLFGFSIGDNYENISFTHFNAYTASISKEIKNYAFALRTYYFDPKAGSTSNYYILNTKRFIDDTQFIGLTLGYGTTPDLADLQTVGFITVDDRLIGLNYERPLVKDTLTLNVGASYENQRFPSGTIRQLSGLSFVLRTAF